MGLKELKMLVYKYHEQAHRLRSERKFDEMDKAYDNRRAMYREYRTGGGKLTLLKIIQKGGK